MTPQIGEIYRLASGWIVRIVAVGPGETWACQKEGGRGFGSPLYAIPEAQLTHKLERAIQVVQYGSEFFSCDGVRWVRVPPEERKPVSVRTLEQALEDLER